MKWSLPNGVIELLAGDITRQTVDAIVNAANSGLAGGGGVDGAIHSAGGTAIMRETDRRYPTGCRTGTAVISRAGNLPMKYVIHAVGPIWEGGGHGEPELLAGAYRRALELAAEYHCESVAFPAVSCGVYGYPLDEAAPLALRVVSEFLKQKTSLLLVRFVLFDPRAQLAFESALQALIRQE